MAWKIISLLFFTDQRRQLCVETTEIADKNGSALGWASDRRIFSFQQPIFHCHAESGTLLKPWHLRLIVLKILIKARVHQNDPGWTMSRKCLFSGELFHADLCLRMDDRRCNLARGQRIAYWKHVYLEMKCVCLCHLPCRIPRRFHSLFPHCWRRTTIARDNWSGVFSQLPFASLQNVNFPFCRGEVFVAL